MISCINCMYFVVDGLNSLLESQITGVCRNSPPVYIINIGGGGRWQQPVIYDARNGSCGDGAKLVNGEVIYHE